MTSASLRLPPALLACLLAAGCTAPQQGRIIVLDRPHPVSATVVSFQDGEGYDGHLEHCFFQPDRVLPLRPAAGCDTPRRYSSRGTGGLAARIREAIDRSGYDLDLLRERVDQVVLHYDVCGTSARCFQVLHDVRGLSCHFLLDLDGTVYQTLDLVHRARHATKANDRSIGIEIAHMGAYASPRELDRWYGDGGGGPPVFRPPPAPAGSRTPAPGFAARPARPDLFRGVVNGVELFQYDFTEEQYGSLIPLLRALREVFPRIEARVPLDESGAFTFEKMDDSEFEGFAGILGHYHVQRNKSDPGPATDWARILAGISAP